MFPKFVQNSELKQVIIRRHSHIPQRNSEQVCEISHHTTTSHFANEEPKMTTTQFQVGGRGEGVEGRAGRTD